MRIVCTLIRTAAGFGPTWPSVCDCKRSIPNSTFSTRYEDSEPDESLIGGAMAYQFFRAKGFFAMLAVWSLHHR